MSKGFTKGLASVALCVLMLALLPACGQKNTIDLRYQPVSTVGKNCSSKIAIVKFADSRPSKELGDKEKQSFFFPSPGQDVPTWMSRALEQELSVNGCSTEFADKPHKFNADYVITGNIKTAYLAQTSMMDYRIDLVARIVLLDKNSKIIDQKDYTGGWDKKTVSDSKEDMLKGALQDFLKPVVNDVLRNAK